MSNPLLTDEEIDKLCLDNRLNLVPIEIISRKIAKAQAKKLVEWLDERMLSNDYEETEGNIITDRILLAYDWQALKKEVGLED